MGGGESDPCQPLARRALDFLPIDAFRKRSAINKFLNCTPSLSHWDYGFSWEFAVVFKVEVTSENGFVFVSLTSTRVERRDSTCRIESENCLVFPEYDDEVGSIL